MASRTRRALASLCLLLCAAPALAAQVVRAPVRLPTAVTAAAYAVPSLYAPTQTAGPSLAAGLAAPRLSSILPAPAVAPSVAPGYVETQSGLLVPRSMAEGASSALGATLELQQVLSETDGAAVGAVLSKAYDGGRVKESFPGAAIDAVEVPAAGQARPVFSQSGTQLLAALHEQSGRGYRAHEYKESSQYMFGVADNIVSHGVRGVVDAYSGIFVPGTSHDGGDYPEKGDQNGDGWSDKAGMNVEHTWPQSFFDKALPMRSDLHHLLPTFQHPNSMRSNLPFGEVQGRPEYSNSAGAKLGGGVFEPPNASKGKVARAILYFYTRYYDRNIYQGAYTRRFFEANVEMFLRWNREHPPDADELRRNDLVERFQGNRNPFVDDPSLADRIGAAGFGRRGGGAGGIARPAATPTAVPYRPGSSHNGRRHGRRAAPALVAPLDFNPN